jgi:cytochrome b561
MIGPDRLLEHRLGEVHLAVRLVLLGLIGLHAAALNHHFWRRDDTLDAMLPQRRRSRDRAAGPAARRV